MYAKTNVVDIDKIISLIKTGRVVVRNVKNSQIYDIYGNVYGDVFAKKPMMSFENNWAEKTYILYMDGEPVDLADYSNDCEAMPECKEMARLMGACIERYRVQNETTSANNNDVLEYRKGVFAKLMDKMRAGRQ